MTVTRRARTSVIAIGLAAALVGAACGGSDDSTGGDSVATPPTDATSTVATTESSTTTAATTTAATTTAAPTTTAVTTTTVAPTTTAAPVASDYCEGAAPLPVGAAVLSSASFDVQDDGTADDVVEVYDLDGVSRLRLTTGGSVVSEIVNSAIDGSYRTLGIAPVFSGDSAELFAVIGDGSAATEVGVFGIDAAGCLFGYTYADSGDDFTMLIRPTSPFRSGAICFEGGIGLVSAEQTNDGTWMASGAAYEIATPGTLQYLGASDDFSEGIDESELGSFEFDCFDLAL